ncbi:MAG: diadenosine tetraphosphate hydrolase [Propionibacteriaceae bacterium]|nr:diadenosine tetraphosphate hydrolase [Propionibacteriaceae bacterium]
MLARLDASFAALGDVQFLPGYCVVMCDRPGINLLSDLPRRDRVRYLADVDLVATAVQTVCAARDAGLRRVNVEILGNTDAFLHAHIWPRYSWEPAEIVGYPVWGYPHSMWDDPATQVGPQHDELRTALTAEILRLHASPEFQLSV